MPVSDLHRGGIIPDLCRQHPTNEINDLRQFPSVLCETGFDYFTCILLRPLDIGTYLITQELTIIHP